MVRLLGYSAQAGSDDEEFPREIESNPCATGDNGWLIRFLDSSFFCEWIAISYLFKHEHPGVRDYLCNKMYSLQLSGIESYIFQLCYMLVHKSSAALEKFIIDMCSKSLRIALKVHWFLLAEVEEFGDQEDLRRLQEKCQMASLMGDWPPLVKPKKPETSPSSKNRMFKLLSSRRLLNLATSPTSHKTSSPVGSPNPLVDEEAKNLSEESDSSLKVFKKLMPGPKVRDVFLKKFRDREDEETERSKENEQRPKEAETESFFRRFLRDKDEEEKGIRTEDLVNSESFFRRIFRDKLETEDKSGSKSGEEEGFFRRLFRDRIDDREKPDDEEKGTVDVEDNSESFFFRRIFRIHPEDERFPVGMPDSVDVNTPDNSPGSDSFFKRLFRDRSLEETTIFGLRKEDGSSPSNFLKKLFKDRNDEGGNTPVEDVKVIDHNDNGVEQTETETAVDSTAMNSVQDVTRLCQEGTASRMEHTSVTENWCSQAPPDSNGSHKSMATTEQFSRNLLNIRGMRLTDIPPGRLFGLRPGSPKQNSERSSLKPPLPKYSSFYLRKGTYHATLDFIQSLCDISSGLTDVFPLEDRRKSLQESLVELNGLLAKAQNDGGVCFPMGKGLYRVVHLPEDEAALCNSREKAPYLVCLEVLKCDEQSHSTQHKESGSQKPLHGGIPLAIGDVQLHRPPPWAYPLWNQSSTQQNSTDNMLRAASQAIDKAMNHLWEMKVKYVHVSLSVSERCMPQHGYASNQASVVDNTSMPSLCVEDRSLHIENVIDENATRGLSKNAEGETVERLKNMNLAETKFEGSVSTNKIADRTERESCTQEWVSVVLTAVPGVNMEDVGDEDHSNRRDHRRVPSTIAMAQVKAAADKGESPAGLPIKISATATLAQSEDTTKGNAKATDALAGELWEHRKERIRRTSKFGNSAGWDLCSVIVKSGDDCRQELLAVQLISHFYDIFQEAGLPLWLRPYEVLVTSSYTSLIETIPDTASIHAIKSRNPNISSLRDFFCKKYEENSPLFKLAQRNFVESMAGYSILSYFLQVKDRHNGNLLIDEEGHILHIDFGFMLSNSPGGVNFESAPFKLTRELLEVMDSDAEGTSSEFFDYFKVLCIQGFLTCRKHAERIILLVEMMQDSGYPCFKGGPRTIQQLRKRFHLSLTEEQCVSLVLSLISNSLDAWRTRQYDYYQRVLNGIL